LLLLLLLLKRLRGLLVERGRGRASRAESRRLRRRRLR
jgi:hypothetical protein